MIKLIFKKFTSNNKKTEAKKRAMEMYERMQATQKIKSNRNLEEELLKQKDPDYFPDVNDYKSDEYKQKVDTIINNFKFVPNLKKKLDINEKSNFKIEDDTLFYSLNDIFKNKIEENEWINIYQLKKDESYETFKKIITCCIILLVIYKSFKYYIKYAHKNYVYKRKDVIYSFLFYSFTFAAYFANRGTDRRTITKMLLNKINGEKLRVYLHNNDKANSRDLDIGDIFSITSRKKNIHEILFRDNSNYKKSKVTQIFAYKNAIYDPHLLGYICHPKIKRIKIKNLA